MTHDIARRPNRIPWPPLLYLAALLAGVDVTRNLMRRSRVSTIEPMS